MSHRNYLNRNLVYCAVVLLVVLQGTSVGAALAGETVHYYKMLSGVQYEGTHQFNSQAETQFCVTKKNLGNQQVDYVISDIASVPSNLKEQGVGFPVKESDLEDIYLTIDRATHKIIRCEQAQTLLAQACNQGIDSIKNADRDRVGKHWTETVDLSGVNSMFTDEVQLKMSAISVPVDDLGDMIAIRAISAPVSVEPASGENMPESIQAKVRTVYLFDSALENVYLSICVYEASAAVNGQKEKLRHEIATYKTDPQGTPIELKGLNEKFELFVRKVGLRSTTVEGTEYAALPVWARNEALRASQIMNVSAAAICEGALNPVASVSVPSCKMVAAQSFGHIGVNSGLPSVARSLAQNFPGMGTMKIAVAPAAMGAGFGQTALVGGAIGGGVAAAGSGGGSDARSPSSL